MKKKIQNYTEYLFLKIFIYTLHFFPANFAKKIGILTAQIVFKTLPIRKKHIIQSLKLAFPEKTDAEILKVTKDVYIQFAYTIIEIMFFPVMSKEQLKNMIEFENLYILENSRKNGKGTIILSAHFGNWEALAMSTAQRYPLSVIVAKQSNMLVDKMIDDIRTTKGFKTIYKDNMAYKAVVKALRKNEVVAILADQDANKQGVFVPFFNRMASTAKGPAIFALRADCPLLCGFGVRQQNGKYLVKLYELKKPDTSNEEKDIELLMAQYSRLLEEHIRQNPSYWFWFHRRWKTIKE